MADPEITSEPADQAPAAPDEPALPPSEQAPAAQAPPKPAPAPSPPLPWWSPIAGQSAGYLALALIEVVSIVVAVPRPHEGLGLRAAHLAWHVAQTLGLGMVQGAALALGHAIVDRAPSSKRLLLTGIALALYTAFGVAVMRTAVGLDMNRQALVLFEGRFETPLYAAFTLLAGMACPAIYLIGITLCRRPILRVIPIVIAIAGVIVDMCFYRDDYFGIHGVIAWCGATLMGAAIAPLAVRAAHALSAPPRRYGLLAIAIAAIASFVVPPPNRLRFELFRNPTAIAPWALATALWRVPRATASPEGAGIAAEWLRDREGLDPSPPMTPPFLDKNPVVVLITIDALRADAIGDPANDAMFPTFTEMKREGAFFTRAIAPGSQTAVSLTAAFTSRYFSQLHWSMHGVGSTRFAYAADDTSVRFPQLLTDRGVMTASYCSINFLAAEFGVARGFKEQRVIPEGRRHAAAKQMIDPLLDRLRRVSDEPAFLFVHLTEPHAPYDRGRKDGTEHQKYLSEVAVADSHVARVWRLLKARFPTRGVLIVSSDHGEAFGEHETYQHTKTLYEELLRVPLLVRGAGVARAQIDEPVGLIDLGPTILDVFGVPSPASFMGQSLAPLLAGKRASLTRPLAAEGRLRRALYTPSGLKVITDERRKVVEVYDLGRDPGELDNLYGKDPARTEPALAALAAFFSAHTLSRPGYSPPYKP